MPLLVIDRQDAALAVDGQRLLVSMPGSVRPTSIPLSQISRLIISSGVQLSGKVLLALVKAGVPASAIGYRDLACAEITSTRNGNILRRLAQYKASQEADWCLIQAKNLIRWKCLRLYRHAWTQHDTNRGRHTGRVHLNRLSSIIKSIDEATSTESLLGLEGAFARLYWQQYALWMPVGMGFEGRNRRPPRDPANALLSLAYTLGHSESVRALLSTGLDPLLGFYHAPTYGRESLACDMMELLRPVLTVWVLDLSKQRIITADHFSTAAPHGACLMGKTGRKLFYQHWAQERQRICRLTTRIARHWVTILESHDAGITA